MVTNRIAIPRRRAGLIAVIGLTLLATPATVIAGAFSSASAARDFKRAPHQANPQPDGTGLGQWAFLQSDVSLIGTPASYARLRTFMRTAFGVPKLEQWTGSYQSNINDLLPAIGVNATGRDRRISGIRWPKATMRMHPAPNVAAVLAWHATGSVTAASVHGTVAKMDTSCGSGATWALEDSRGNAKASGTLSAHSRKLQRFKARLSSSTGKALYFVLGPAANGDIACDSTAVDIAVVPS